jgi:hypothetical protein
VQATLQKTAIYTSPFDGVAVVLLRVAGSAKHLKVALVVRSAFGKRDDVVNLQSLVLLSARSASAFGHFAKRANIFGRERSFRAEFAGAPSVTSCFRDNANFLRVLLNPAHDFGAVAAWVFGPAFSRPLSFKARSRIKPSLMFGRIANDANAVACEAGRIVAVLARLSGQVRFLFRFLGGKACRMSRALCGVAKRGFAGALSAEVSNNIALRDVPAFARCSWKPVLLACRDSFFPSRKHDLGSPAVNHLDSIALTL